MTAVVECIDKVATTSKLCTSIAAINEEHRLACRCRDDAVRHAIKAGQMLLEQKQHIDHGEFGKWVAENCTFKYSTAARYMAAAKQDSTGVEISSLRQLFPSGRERAKARQAVTQIKDGAPPRSATRGADREIRGRMAAPLGEKPSSSKLITIDVAIKMLPVSVEYSPLIGRVRIAQSKVTVLRNKLKDAEFALADAERAVIRAATELEAQTTPEAKALVREIQI